MSAKAADHRVYFQSFSWYDTDPTLLIDREDEREQLYGPLKALVTAPPTARRGLSMVVVGGKGVGKSIGTLAVLRRLREEHSGQAAIVSVDCRSHRGWREVLAGVAEGLRDELIELQDVKIPVPPYAIDAASLLRDLAWLDEAKEERLHEFTATYTRKGTLSAALELRKGLSVELGLDVTVKDTQRRAVSGGRLLDDGRVSNLLVALLTDLQRDGLRVVVFIDNLDELDHRYATASERGAVRQEVEGLLKLREAPIALILNARTYFSGALGRVTDPPLLLKPLPPALLCEALTRRLRDEPEAVREALRTPETQEEVRWLSTVSESPLEFLCHVHRRAQAGTLRPDLRETGARQELESLFPNLTLAQLERVIRAFEGRPTQHRAALEDALGRDYLFLLAIDNQLILPVDFWRPEEFTLDARLFPLRALLAG